LPPGEKFLSAKDLNPPQCFEAAARSRIGEISPTRRFCVHVPHEFVFDLCAHPRRSCYGENQGYDNTALD
jgi:hypothetical protein